MSRKTRGKKVCRQYIIKIYFLDNTNMKFVFKLNFKESQK